MGVAVEREETFCRRGPFGELVVDILSRRIAVDLDGDACVSCRLEHLIPVCRDTRTRSVLPPARVTENVHARRPHRVDHPGCLIRRSSEGGVWRGDDELELAELVPFHVDR